MLYMELDDVLHSRHVALMGESITVALHLPQPHRLLLLLGHHSTPTLIQRDV